MRSDEVVGVVADGEEEGHEEHLPNLQKQLLPIVVEGEPSISCETSKATSATTTDSITNTTSNFTN